MRDGTYDQIARIHKGRQQCQDHARGNRHEHVVGSELPFANAMQQVFVV